MTDLAEVEHEPALPRRPLVLGIEIAVFGALSVVLHLFLVSRPPEGGIMVPAGERTMAFEGASPALTALVEHWSQPLPTPSAPEPLTNPESETDRIVQPHVFDLTVVRSPSPEPVLDRSTAPRQSKDLPTEPDPIAQPVIPSAMPRTPPSAVPPGAMAGQLSTPLLTSRQPGTLAGPSSPGEPPPNVPHPPDASEVLAAESAPSPVPKPDRRAAPRPSGDSDTAWVTSPARRAPATAHRAQSGALDGASTPDLRSGLAPESTQSLSEAQTRSLLQSLGAQVLAAIARERHYPRQALRRRLEGTATLEVTIDRSGRLVQLSVQHSSGLRMLDDAASSAARAVRRFPSAPDELPGGSFTFTIPVRFTVR